LLSVVVFGLIAGTSSATDRNESQPSFGTPSIVVFDQAKCLSSCDDRYLSCAKGGDAERIKYCSNQHDQCRNACLAYKG
jgi:hypothetical protein